MRSHGIPPKTSFWPLFDRRSNHFPCHSKYKLKNPCPHSSLYLFWHLGGGQFADSEWLLLCQKSGEQQAQLFHQFWALKECHIKATGVGLAEDLGSIEFRFDPTSSGESVRHFQFKTTNKHTKMLIFLHGYASATSATCATG